MCAKMKDLAMEQQQLDEHCEYMKRLEGACFNPDAAIERTPGDWGSCPYHEVHEPCRGKYGDYTAVWLICNTCKHWEHNSDMTVEEYNRVKLPSEMVGDMVAVIEEERNQCNQELL